MILITRSGDGAVKTCDALSEHNISALTESLTEFKPLLDVKVEWGNKTLLITSANSVRALLHITNEREYEIIAIGAATAQYAIANGFYNVRVAGQNAYDLINYVIRCCERGKKLLYVSGESISLAVDKILSSYGWVVDRAVVYCIMPHRTLSKKCHNALLNNGIDAVMFFSLDVARLFLRLILKHRLYYKLSNMTAYSLSIRITNALVKGDWKSICTSDYPTHDSLLDMIINN